MSSPSRSNEFRRRIASRAVTDSALESSSSSLQRHNVVSENTQNKVVFHPDSLVRRWWDYAMAAITLYTVFSVPYQIAVQAPSSTGDLVWEMFVWLMYVADFYISSRTAYFNSGALIDDPDMILKRYARSWMSADLVSAIPTDLILHVLGHHGTNILAIRSLKLSRLVRIFRLDGVINRISLATGLSEGGANMIQLGIVVGTVSYVSACGYILLDDVQSHEKESWWDSYRDKTDQSNTRSNAFISGLHFALTTLATVGYGDIAPKTHADRIYSILSMLLGVTFFSFAIGVMTSIIQTMDSTEEAKEKRLQEVRHWLAARKFNFHLKLRIREYFKKSWNKRQAQISEAKILSELSGPLRHDILLILASKIVKKVPFFSDISTRALADILSYLRPVSIRPGEVIIREGEVGDGIYFLSRGRIKIYSMFSGEVFRTLGDDSYFGEVSMISDDGLRTASARSQSFCDMFYLSKQDFNQIIANYPDIIISIRTLSKRDISMDTSGAELGFGCLKLSLEALGYKKNRTMDTMSSEEKKSMKEIVMQISEDSGDAVIKVCQSGTQNQCLVHVRKWTTVDDIALLCRDIFGLERHSACKLSLSICDFLVPIEDQDDVKQLKSGDVLFFSQL